MEDIVQVDNQIYVRASSTLADQRLRVLKYGETFGIFDVYGDIKPVGIGTQGLYFGATRMISQMELRVDGRYPTYLSSSITNDDMLLTADLSNSDIAFSDGNSLRHSNFHIFRSKFLSEDSCYEEVLITNFSNSECIFPLSFLFKTDFVDMFEIRGVPRESRGTYFTPICEKDTVIFMYEGLDKKIRGSRVFFDPPPTHLTSAGCKYDVCIPAKEKSKFFITINCFTDKPPKEKPKTFSDVYPEIKRQYSERMATGCEINVSSERFRTWVNRSKSDILLMTTKGNYGYYPYAGIPWFNTIFGRDGIITALQYLWIDPSLARDVLTYLSKLQSLSDEPYEDAEPGKILHELRTGEMVATGEVPFKKYYGSVDATPLFIILAGKYLEMTADIRFIESIWPAIENALIWINSYGDRDSDGFLEYIRRSPKGLENQGWKDSSDSISHEDGRLAEGPIALAEVQGYAYEAKIQAAKIAERLGRLDLSTEILGQAEKLRQQFQEHFWSPRLECVVLALDGDKNRCNVVSSNAGQTLFSGILTQQQAEMVAKKMMSDEMFSGWGIRTLSSREKRYNPMSYHNGSIWPHDNSLIAEGLARYELKNEVLKLTEALFDVSTNVDLFRLPELFCGFSRRMSQGPTLYPVACSPQAWAAGSVFLLLKACLGLNIDGFSSRISFSHPVLPSVIEELWLNKLQVGQAEVDLLFRRHGSDINVYVERREGKVEVSVLK